MSYKTLNEWTTAEKGLAADGALHPQDQGFFEICNQPEYLSNLLVRRRWSPIRYVEPMIGELLQNKSLWESLDTLHLATETTTYSKTQFIDLRQRWLARYQAKRESMPNASSIWDRSISFCRLQARTWKIKLSTDAHMSNSIVLLKNYFVVTM